MVTLSLGSLAECRFQLCGGEEVPQGVSDLDPMVWSVNRLPAELSDLPHLPCVRICLTPPPSPRLSFSVSFLPPSFHPHVQRFLPPVRIVPWSQLCVGYKIPHLALGFRSCCKSDPRGEGCVLCWHTARSNASIFDKVCLSDHTLLTGISTPAGLDLAPLKVPKVARQWDAPGCKCLICPWPHRSPAIILTHTRRRKWVGHLITTTIMECWQTLETSCDREDGFCDKIICEGRIGMGESEIKELFLVVSHQGHTFWASLHCQFQIVIWGYSYRGNMDRVKWDHHGNISLSVI